VITGTTTGLPPSVDDLWEAASSTSLPIVIGSGMTAENVGDYASLCQSMIVGSTLKEEGDWRRLVDGERVREFMQAKNRS
jgi:predicted TIM-barrel enzyme